ncbi:MAG: hypothetical protein HYT70_04300 [Candidatus Aenigmarchaeota archaeon]|nr:hypothetical protein [Candidatus Aenigmarchaeota archaeon]
MARYKIPMVFKIFLFALIATSATSLFFVYIYYSESQEQAELIKLQTSEIENNTHTIGNLQVKITNLTSTAEKLQTNVKNLQTTVGNQEKEIVSNERTINTLTQDISNLISDIQKKTVTIDDLGVKLTGTQQKLEDLKPTVKDYYVVGITSTGGGVVIPIEVKVVKGSGSILVNVKNVDLGQQAQDSIRTAAIVGGNYSGISIVSKDITVTFVHEGSQLVTIDGGSGGAALTASIVAALENRTMNTKVLVTGTIESDQTIGQVGSVANKASAAKEFGATSFLVPAGQGVSVGGIEVVEVDSLSQVVSRVLT